MRREKFEEIKITFYKNGTWKMTGLLSKEHKLTPSKDSPIYNSFMQWKRISHLF